MATLYGWAVKIKGLDADHTYVTSSDGGKWGCWGRDAGGQTICSGQGSSKQANCLSQSSSHAGIVYAITGVCHQTANRILYFARVIVSQAKGYWASSAVYGTYGTGNLAAWIEWQARLARCKKVKGDLGPVVTAAARKAALRAVEETPAERGMRAYLNKVNALYAEHARTMKVAALAAAKETDFLPQELELMADYRLGADVSVRTVAALQKVQRSVLQEKAGLDAELIGKDIAAGDYAKKVNGLVAQFLKESEAQLGEEAHAKLFGEPAGAEFQIVDLKILAQYHEE